MSVEDTSTLAQCDRLLAYLRHSAISTSDCRRILNIMHPAARVQQLREGGHNIVTQRVQVTDEHGRSHSNVALYTLRGGS